MQRLEILAIIVAVLVIVGTPAATFGYEAFLRSQTPNEITVIASAPENGNWSPTTIRVKQGETIRLRLRSEDIAHGLAIPGLGVEVREIYPGKFTTVEFVADKAGSFPFFCTVLCSPKHGSMKGEIIVEATGRQGQATEVSKAEVPPKPQAPATVEAPTKAETAAKVDSPQKPETSAKVEAPAKPDTAPKIELPVNAETPVKAEAPPKAETPAKVEAPAKAEPSADELALGQKVYQSNCAACHGRNAEGAIGPALPGLTREQIVTKVRQAKGPMPAFSQQQISDADLEKLVKFIASLSNR